MFLVWYLSKPFWVDFSNY